MVPGTAGISAGAMPELRRILDWTPTRSSGRIQLKELSLGVRRETIEVFRVDAGWFESV